MASLLQQFSIETILIIVFVLAGGFYTYVKALYGDMRTWWDRADFNVKLPETIQKIEKDVSEQRQESDDRTDALNSMLILMQEKQAKHDNVLEQLLKDNQTQKQAIKEIDKELKILKDCSRQQMREIIRHQYEVYQKDGFISTNTLAWLEEVYQTYHSVRGNGVATAWMEEMRGNSK